jgi:hypothetical protein
MQDSNLLIGPIKKAANKLFSYLIHPLRKHLGREGVSKFWFTLVAVTGLAALWFFGSMCQEAFCYLILSNKTSVHVEKWGVKEISSSEYAVFAEYSYQVKDKQYKGKTIFTTRSYLNAYAAEKAIPDWKNKSWKASYSSWSPKYSSLQRNFSLKSAVRALLAAGVCLYFITLRSSFKKEPQDPLV